MHSICSKVVHSRCITCLQQVKHMAAFHTEDKARSIYNFIVCRWLLLSYQLVLEHLPCNFVDHGVSFIFVTREVVVQFANGQSTREDCAQDHLLQSVMDMEAVVLSSVVYHWGLFSAQKKRNFGCNLFVFPSHFTALNPPFWVRQSPPLRKECEMGPPPPPPIIKLLSAGICPAWPCPVACEMVWQP